MAEELKSLDTAAGYGGTVRGPGVEIPAYEAEPWHKYADRLIDRLAEAVANAAALELFKDDGGELTFGVRPGLVRNGDTLYTFVGCTDTLTDDATNYIYLTAANLAAGNTVSIATDAFPLQSATPHIPLGTIVAADGVYAHDNIDQAARQRSMLILGFAMTAANANTLVAGAASNADALHVHAVAGLQAAVQNLVPYLTVTGYDDADGTASIAIVVKNAAGVGISGRFRVRVWVSTTDCGAPVAQSDFGVGGGVGTELQPVEADADYETITDASGLLDMDLTAPDGTYYVMAEVDGRIYSGSVAITGN